MKSYLYNRSFQVKVGCSATNFYPDKGTAGICAQPYTILYILFTTHLFEKPVNITATYTSNTAALASLRVSKIIVQMRSDQSFEKFDIVFDFEGVLDESEYPLFTRYRKNIHCPIEFIQISKISVMKILGQYTWSLCKITYTFLVHVELIWPPCSYTPPGS